MYNIRCTKTFDIFRIEIALKYKLLYKKKKKKKNVVHDYIKTL